jgi:PAS domain-containing protein
MLKWLKAVVAANRDCKIDEYFRRIDSTMQDVINKCTRIENQLEAEINSLTEEVAMYKGMLHSIAEALPDMMWCKDLDGKYVYANQAIIDGLLLNRAPIGKGDVELAMAAKARYGDENHTFGEKCANSDVIVLDTGEAQRFLESGKVKGKVLYLEVFKAPWVVNGVVRGVVGTGRDMTEYVEAYREQNCGGCGRMADIFKKYEYGED